MLDDKKNSSRFLGWNLEHTCLTVISGIISPFWSLALSCCWYFGSGSGLLWFNLLSFNVCTIQLGGCANIIWESVHTSRIISKLNVRVLWWGDFSQLCELTLPCFYRIRIRKSQFFEVIMYRVNQYLIWCRAET